MDRTCPHNTLFKNWGVFSLIYQGIGKKSVTKLFTRKCANVRRVLDTYQIYLSFLTVVHKARKVEKTTQVLAVTELVPSVS